VILVDEGAQDLAPADARELSGRQRDPRFKRIWWTQPQGTVRAMSVIVADVEDEHSAEVPLVQDEKSVGALRSQGAYPAFGERVRVGCSNGAAHNARILALPHRVEARTELVVAVTEQVLDSDVTRATSHAAGHTAVRSKGTALGTGITVTESSTVRPTQCAGIQRVGAAERGSSPVRAHGPEVSPEMTDSIIARANEPRGMGVIPHPVPDGVVRPISGPVMRGGEESLEPGRHNRVAYERAV
jgi:hypothetical protein